MLKVRQSPQYPNIMSSNIIDLDNNVKMQKTEFPLNNVTDDSVDGKPSFTNNVSTTPTKQKRTKERKIGEILNKVCLWRKLYNGYTDPITGETIKMSLEDAAHRVGISKKSLDDYLLQIRYGFLC